LFAPLVLLALSVPAHAKKAPPEPEVYSAEAPSDATAPKSQSLSQFGVYVDPPLEGPPSAPPALNEDEPDWVMLFSGEWLQGRVKSLRAGTLTFDSAEVGVIRYDWDDVRALHLSRSHEVQMKNRDVYTGPAVFWADYFIIDSKEAGVVTLPKNKVHTMITGTGKEIDYWNFYVSMGLSGSWGNTEQATFEGAARFTREDTMTKWTAGYDGIYTIANDQVAANRHLGDTSLDVYVTSIFRVVVATADALYDPFQNIQIRTRPGAGLGFRHTVNRYFTWYGTTGGIYQFTRYKNPLANGASGDFHGGGMYVKLDFEIDPHRDVDIDFGWRSTFIFNDFGQSASEGYLRFQYTLGSLINLYTRFAFNRIESPPLQADGTQPVSNDLVMSAGVAIDY